MVVFKTHLVVPICDSMSELDEVIGEFLVESHENLDRLDQDLVALEEDSTNKQLLATCLEAPPVSSPDNSNNNPPTAAAADPSDEVEVVIEDDPPLDPAANAR